MTSIKTKWRLSPTSKGFRKVEGPSVKTAKKIRWDPIITKLADYEVKQNTSREAIETAESSQSNSKWVKASQKRGSKKEFEALLHDLFDRNGPVMKYQNPDVWNVYPSKKQSGSSN